MTDYQMNLVVDMYFNTLLDKGISENDVKDFGQEEGVLYIVLEDKTIKEKIKNFNN